MKCKDYKAYSVLCQNCDIKHHVKCCKEFNFNKPQKYIEVEREDFLHTSWNICPTCGASIGYSPKDTKFRCPKCGQRIIWLEEEI